MRLPKLGYMSFGERLRTAIEIANSDRAKLAKELEISVQAISQVILGKSNAFSADNTVRASRFLRVDPFWLATGEGEPRDNSKMSPDAVKVAITFDAMSERQQRSFLRVMQAFMAEDPGGDLGQRSTNGGVTGNT